VSNSARVGLVARMVGRILARPGGPTSHFFIDRLERPSHAPLILASVNWRGGGERSLRRKAVAMGFLFGTACLIGLFVMIAKHRHHRRWGGHWGGGRCGGRGWGGGYDSFDDSWGRGDGPGGGRGVFLRSGLLRHLSMRLGASPGQEKVIASAADEVMDAGRSAHEQMRASKKEMAELFAGPSFDESLLVDVFSRQDETIRGFRQTVAGALGKVHEALEPEQRQRLADLITRGNGFRAF
jgi:Spy/CpxP family protein refolding chaperone